jgi:hypothetical protein
MKVKISRDDLEMLGLVGNAVSDDKSRPILNNVNLENGLAVATDGHIIRVERLESLAGMSGQIDPKAIQNAKKMAKLDKKAKEVDLEILTEGLERYPQWRNCISRFEAFNESCNPWFNPETMKKLFSTFEKNRFFAYKFMSQIGGMTKGVLVVRLKEGKMEAIGLVMPVRAGIGEIEDLIESSPLFGK